jgi:hypothetical protein
MIELLRYLEANGFTAYIASGGDRDFMRPLVSSRRRHRTVHAIFPHTAPRRSSRGGIQRRGRHGRLGRGATMAPLRWINPSRFGDW